MSKKNRLLSTILLLSLVMTLVFAVNVSAASLNKINVTIKKGSTVQLKVTGAYKKVLSWSSANKAIATVSNKGLVTGKKVGDTIISAKVKLNSGSTKTYKCKVHVIDKVQKRLFAYRLVGDPDNKQYSKTEVSGKNYDTSGFSMMGKLYRYGIRFYVDPDADGDDREAYALHNLNGDYNQFKFTIGALDSDSQDCAYKAKMKIYLDGVLVKTYKLDTEMVTSTKTINVKDTVQMKILIQGEDITDSDLYAYYGLADPIGIK